MNEQDFQLLLTLEKTKNITHAADILYVTQSSLSKRITQLERELKVQLLLRSRQGIRFTPEGETVLHHIHHVVGELTNMRGALHNIEAEVSGTLRAGVSVNFSQYRLPDILAKYRQLYPRVTTNVTTEHSRNLYLRLMNQELDIAILRGEFPWTGAKKLLSQEKICIITTEEQQHIPLTELPFIGRVTDSSFERSLIRWFHEQNLPLSTEGITVDNIGTCVEMVKRGLGWSAVPEIGLSDFTGILRPMVFADGTPFIRATYLMYHEFALSLRQVKAFIELTESMEASHE